MGLRTTLSFVSACRRGLSAILCVLMLVAVVIPASDAFAVDHLATAETVLAAAGDNGEPTSRDPLPCHAVHHCGCNVPAVAPVSTETRPPTCSAIKAFINATSDALASGIQVPPVKPPRV